MPRVSRARRVLTWKRAERGVSKEPQPGGAWAALQNVDGGLTTSDQGRCFRKTPGAAPRGFYPGSKRARLWARVQGEPRSHGFQGKKNRRVRSARCPSEPGVELRGQGEKQAPLATTPSGPQICQSAQQVPQNKSAPPRLRNAHRGSKTQFSGGLRADRDPKPLGTSSQNRVWPQCSGWRRAIGAALATSSLAPKLRS